MARIPTETERAQSDLMLDLTQHRGFRTLMALIDRKGQELLNNLLDATDNPNIPTEQRKELIYQIACNLAANREIKTSIDMMICAGKTDEELQAINPNAQSDDTH